MRALEMIESGGGSAANAAATIGRLGGAVELWARIGDDEAGAKVRAFLEADGVDTRHLRTLACGAHVDVGRHRRRQGRAAHRR